MRRPALVPSIVVLAILPAAHSLAIDQYDHFIKVQSDDGRKECITDHIQCLSSM